MNANGKRILVTGGAGFIGSHLCKRLLDEGNEVTALDDLSTGSDENISEFRANPNFKLVQGSILDQDLVDVVVQDCELIFHLAASVGVSKILQDPVGSLKTNVNGSHSVLESANKHGSKVFLASTSEVYGKNPDIPFREDANITLGATSFSRWSYAAGKVVDEFLALGYYQQYGTPVVVVRFFNTIGPGQTGAYGMVAPRFVRQSMNGEPLTVYGDGLQSRCFCDVADVIEALIGLMDCPAAEGQVFNIGSTTEITMLELAKLVLANTKEYRASAGLPDSIDGGVVFVPYSEAYPEGFEDMRRRVPDTNKIRSLTGWQPRLTLEQTIQRIIEHQVSHPSREVYK